MTIVLAPRSHVLALAILAGVAGCQTSQPAGEQATLPPSAAVAAAPLATVQPETTDAAVAAQAALAAEDSGPEVEPLEDDLSADGEEEPEIVPEDFADGFCPDDIYAKHIIGQYLAANPDATKLTKAQERFRRRYHLISAGSMEALVHAKGRMTGRTVPYFGAIPVVANPAVELWITYYKTTGRREFMRWLVRGESVRETVQPLLQASGVPIEFFYLAMVESGFSNRASSRARATGTWQFMRATAQRYGLRVDHWVDERRDPVKSTLAAAAYLKDLYRELGDWHLAMAAYNAGPGKVRKAIRLGKTRDFWKIAQTDLLAKETKQYVPKVLAATLLSTNAASHGFAVAANENDKLPQAHVLVHRPIRLDELAAQIGVPLKTLRQWNPELVRDVTPLRKGGYPLRLSTAHANTFLSVETKLSQIKITDVALHVVKHGDTLGRIAKIYKVDVKQILSLNPDLRAKALKIGKEIAVPVPGVVATTGKPGSA